MFLFMILINTIKKVHKLKLNPIEEEKLKILLMLSIMG